MRAEIKVVLLVFILKGFISFNTARIEKKVANTTTSTFIDTLEALHIRFPQVVLAQIIHETGMFKSDIYKENHNCVGMKWNNRGYATGVNRGHAKYPNIWQCLRDYAAWQAKYCPDSIKSNEEYIDWLKKFGYAEDPKYKQSILRTLKLFIQ